MISIKVLGTGCSKCKKLAQRVQQAVDESGLMAEIDKVEKIEEIVEYGVFTTPALLVNGEIKCKGHVPSIKTIKELLAQ